MTTATGLSLHPEHLADLRKSGLTDETILAAGLYSVRPSDLAQPSADELQRLAHALRLSDSAQMSARKHA
jgi:hypothetical protein